MPEGQSYLDLVGNALKHPFARSVGSGVPGSRQIISGNTAFFTVNGGASAQLGAGDITLAVVVSGGGAGVVGVGRTLSATSPLRIDAGGSADLSSNRTLSVLQFGAANAGVVPQTGGVGAGFYLDATGAWVAGTASGVSSVTGTAPVVASPTTGAVVISISAATLTTPGYVPAVGSVDTTMFLQRTNPPGWAVPGTGSFIHLQGSTPGTVDTGHGYISGTFIAGNKISVGSTAPTATLHVKSDNSTDEVTIARHQAGAGTAGLIFRRSRGTEASPAVLSDEDGIGSLQVQPRLTSSWGGVTWLRAAADGAGGATQAFYSDMIAGVTNSYALARLSSAGLRLESLVGSFATAARAKSTLDVQGSLGWKVTTVTVGSTNADDTQSSFLMDCTGGTTTLQLVTASGKAGRIVSIVRIDATSNICQILPFGAQSINGVTGVRKLNRRGEFMLLESDGSNWWTVSEPSSQDRTSSNSETTVANTVAETNIALGRSVTLGVSGNGSVHRLFCFGKLSTTGTPTLRWRLRNGSLELLGDSTALTMPNGVTDLSWQVEYTGISRSLTAPRILTARLYVAQAAGVGSQMNVYEMGDVNLVANFAGAIAEYLTVEWGTASASNTVTCTESLSSLTAGTLLL